MVATSGPGWRLAPCVDELFDESDRRFPKRSKASDGSIGDLAHRQRKSDHNPDGDGDVKAGDLTDDPAAGCDGNLLVRRIVARRDHRVSYLIHDAQITASYPVGATPAWVARTYMGANAHRLHVHVSVKDTAEAKSDRSSWWGPASTPAPAPKPLPRRPTVYTEADFIVTPDGREVYVCAGADKVYPRLWVKIGDGPWIQRPDSALAPGSSPRIQLRPGGTAAVLVTGITGEPCRALLDVENTATGPRPKWGPWRGLDGRVASVPD